MGDWEEGDMGNISAVRAMVAKEGMEGQGKIMGH